MRKAFKQPAKLSLLAAAEVILRRASQPLHSREIVELAISEGLIASRGKSPSFSLQSAIWRDINEIRRDDSPFIMVGEGGKINRRYWLKDKPTPIVCSRSTRSKKRQRPPA